MTAHSYTCKNCSSEVQGELYHLGFSDMDCMYCDSCPRVLLLKEYNLQRGTEFNGQIFSQEI